MATERVGGLRGLWIWLRAWAHRLKLRLVTIEDTPHSIALGVAIGIFFGFTPLWSLKTLLSIAGAWLCRGSKLAAAVSVNLHDLTFPLMPAFFLWEYKFGFWAMHGHFPRSIRHSTLGLRDYLHWQTFYSMGRPVLLGSVILGLPAAAVSYFICRALVTRHRARRPAA